MLRDNPLSDRSGLAARLPVQPHDDAGLRRAQTLMGIGGILAALGASSCCN